MKEEFIDIEFKSLEDLIKWLIDKHQSDETYYLATQHMATKENIEVTKINAELLWEQAQQLLKEKEILG